MMKSFLAGALAFGVTLAAVAAPASADTLADIKAVSYTHLTLPTICSV